MISFYPHKDPARVLKLAILDDVTPPAKGQEYEYWRGETELEPIGKRAVVFRQAMRLYELGRVVLYQVKCNEGYSYRARVV